MSVLTKVLIVLLTISSVFLCGIVVTYVANAENYKEKYDTLKVKSDASKAKLKGLAKQMNDKTAKADRVEEKLNNKIASLKLKYGEMESSLRKVEREKDTLLQKVNSWASITKDFSTTNDKQGVLLKKTLEDLHELQAKQIKLKKELDETTASLIEKMSIIETVKMENRRLLEAKAELKSRFDKTLQPIGRVATTATPVTPQRSSVRQTQQYGTRDIGLQGKITALDLKNSMAGLSIGSSDGVKEGMKFHVTRSDKFICDILIIGVDQEESVGVLDLVQQQPIIGDIASTNL